MIVWTVGAAVGILTITALIFLIVYPLMLREAIFRILEGQPLEFVMSILVLSPVLLPLIWYLQGARDGSRVMKTVRKGHTGSVILFARHIRMGIRGAHDLGNFCDRPVFIDGADPGVSFGVELRSVRFYGLRGCSMRDAEEFAGELRRVQKKALGSLGC